jgi:hypothetical protein
VRLKPKNNVADLLAALQAQGRAGATRTTLAVLLGDGKRPRITGASPGWRLQSDPRV